MRTVEPVIVLITGRTEQVSEILQIISPLGKSNRNQGTGFEREMWMEMMEISGLSEVQRSTELEVRDEDGEVLPRSSSGRPADIRNLSSPIAKTSARTPQRIMEVTSFWPCLRMQLLPLG